MKTWQSADKVLREYNDAEVMEYLFGENSIHAKYTQRLKELDEKLAEEQKYWIAEMERRRRKREQNMEGAERS